MEPHLLFLRLTSPHVALIRSPDLAADGIESDKLVLRKLAKASPQAVDVTPRRNVLRCNRILFGDN